MTTRMAPMMMNGRRRKHLPKDLLLQLSIDSGGTPADGVLFRWWMGVRLSRRAALRFLVVRCGVVIRQWQPWRSRIVSGPWSLKRGKQVRRDYMAIILQNHFGNNARDLLLAEDSRLLRILLWGLRKLT